MEDITRSLFICSCRSERSIPGSKFYYTSYKCTTKQHAPFYSALPTFPFFSSPPYCQTLHDTSAMIQCVNSLLKQSFEKSACSLLYRFTFVLSFLLYAFRRFAVCAQCNQKVYFAISSNTLEQALVCDRGNTN